jgi:hypothetical protein
MSALRICACGRASRRAAGAHLDVAGKIGGRDRGRHRRAESLRAGWLGAFSSTFRSICVIFSAFTRGPFGKRTDTKSC